MIAWYSRARSSLRSSMRSSRVAVAYSRDSKIFARHLFLLVIRMLTPMSQNAARYSPPKRLRMFHSPRDNAPRPGPSPRPAYPQELLRSNGSSTVRKFDVNQVNETRCRPTQRLARFLVCPLPANLGHGPTRQAIRCRPRSEPELCFQQTTDNMLGFSVRESNAPIAVERIAILTISSLIC